MYYIYSLSFNDEPFYIGMTNNPIMRYKGHYYFEGCLTYNFVRYNLINHNKAAKMKLICWCETKSKAMEIESKCIQLLSKAGFNLLNDRYHYFNSNRRPPKYQHYEKLPPKWFTASMRSYILNQQLNVSNLNYPYKWRSNGYLSKS